MKSLQTMFFMSADFVHLLILFQCICFGLFPYFSLLPVLLLQPKHILEIVSCCPWIWYFLV